MLSLGDKQRVFGQLLPRLLGKAQELYPGGVVLGEAERSQAAADWNAAHGKGIKNSLHRLRLAVDIHLFKKVDNIWAYLTTEEAHRELGEWWEQQSGEGYTCCWGGRFGDGNHYSITHNGIK